jgi:hypothetical protein
VAIEACDLLAFTISEANRLKDGMLLVALIVTLTPT